MELDKGMGVMERVVVSNPLHGICAMQVCAVADATDQEILEVCNKENPSGTSNGWSMVIREPDGSLFQADDTAPVSCLDYPERVHFLVLC